MYHVNTVKFLVALVFFYGTSFAYKAIPISPDDVMLQQETGLQAHQITPFLGWLYEQESTCCWVPEYPIVTNLIKSMGLTKGCEVGVAYGMQSEYFLENSAIEKLYSIDPYKYFPVGYDNDAMNLNQDLFNVLFYKVRKRLAPFGSRSILLRNTSEEAATFFQDGSLDFVYIDANHSYAEALKDITLWFAKVRSGGLLAGDDFVVFPSVARAITDFTRTNNIQLNFQGNKWWIIKP